jgi:hypothetical protein
VSSFVSKQCLNRGSILTSQTHRTSYIELSEPRMCRSTSAARSIWRRADALNQRISYASGVMRCLYGLENRYSENDGQSSFQLLKPGRNRQRKRKAPIQRLKLLKTFGNPIDIIGSGVLTVSTGLDYRRKGRTYRRRSCARKSKLRQKVKAVPESQSLLGI